MGKQKGQTKDVGFQFGIRRTLPISAEKAWNFLFSNSGLKVWLGQLKDELEIKKEYETEDGITGLVLVFKANSHIRLKWKPKHWGNTSTLQIRIMGNHEKATIAIHQEKLLDSVQRAEMETYWNNIMLRLSSEINKG